MKALLREACAETGAAEQLRREHRWRRDRCAESRTHPLIAVLVLLFLLLLFLVVVLLVEVETEAAPAAEGRRTSEASEHEGEEEAPSSKAPVPAERMTTSSSKGACRAGHRMNMSNAAQALRNCQTLFALAPWPRR